MRIHLHLPRLASCLFWPIAKSGLNGGVPRKARILYSFNRTFPWTPSGWFVTDIARYMAYTVLPQIL